MDYTGKLTAVKANNIQLVLEEDFNLTEARRRTDFTTAYVEHITRNGTR